MISYISVCSGIEAATCAWHPLGWRPVAFAEIEKFPSAVLASHYPNVPNYGDLSRYKKWIDHTVDLIVGGTPCQAFSVAGLRKGLDDPRGNLSLTFLALVRKYRARWVVWENVPGVLSDRTNAFGHLLAGLGQLGYGWAYRVLDAQYYGVAQRRRRVFVVANLGDWRRAAAVLFESESMRWDPPPSRQSGEDVAGTLSSRTTGGGGLGTDFELGGGVIPSTGDVSHCLNAGGMGRQDYETETLVTHALRGEGFDASEDGTGRGTPLVPVAFDTTQITSAENRCNPQPGDPCHPLARGAHAPAIAFNWQAAGNQTTLGASTESAATLSKSTTQAVALHAAVRRLTPRECERLQGFPDDYTRIIYRGKLAADGPRYKALGNSMAVPVMRWIGQRIAIADTL